MENGSNLKWIKDLGIVPSVVFIACSFATCDRIKEGNQRLESIKDQLVKVQPSLESLPDKLETLSIDTSFQNKKTLFNNLLFFDFGK